MVIVLLTGALLAFVIFAFDRAAGLSDFEMKPQVSERLSAYRDWSVFDGELGKHISLVYLEVEEEAF